MIAAAQYSKTTEYICIRRCYLTFSNAKCSIVIFEVIEQLFATAVNEKLHRICNANKIIVGYRFETVFNEIVKCFINRPVDLFAFYSPNLFLTEQEIRDYDERLLGFTYILTRKGVYGYELKKAFTD